MVGAANLHAPAPEGRDAVDRWAMGLALEEATRAGSKGEIPVGAILLGPHGGEIARGSNTRETEHDPTGHAEIVTLRAGPGGLESVGLTPDGWRLSGCTLYVTLEPCTMCGGAIVLSRISRLVFGAWDPKAGACGSVRDVVRDSRLNHKPEVLGGVQEVECSALLRDFFGERR